MSAPQPANTSEELREAMYDKLKNHGLPLGFLDNPRHWQYFNDALDSCMQLIADHDAKLYLALEAQKKVYIDALMTRTEAVPMSSVRKVFNMKEEADGDSK